MPYSQGKASCEGCIAQLSSSGMTVAAAELGASLTLFTLETADLTATNSNSRASQASGQIALQRSGDLRSGFHLSAIHALSENITVGEGTHPRVLQGLKLNCGRH